VPIAATEEQLALQAAVRDWAKRAGTVSLVRELEPAGPGGSAEPGGPGQPWAAGADGWRHWAELTALGVFAIALPDSVGGAGGTVADVAAALEELTLSLAPGPVLPTVLAGLALAPHTDMAAARRMLAEMGEGRGRTTVVWGDDGLAATPAADGGLRVTGETGPVLSGGDGAYVLAGALAASGPVWFCVPAGHPGVTVTARAPVDFSRPLATVRFDGAVIGPRQVITGLDGERVRALAAALLSVEAAAVAAWCTRTSAAYARTRRQFDRPIGSFQAVKHLCAGQLVRAERAAALAWDAVRAADEAPSEFPLAAAAAAALALDDAVECAKDCIQVLGGIGFTWEHDAHLYLRRALALRHLLGGGSAWRERTAVLALAGARRHLARPLADAAQEEVRPDQVVGIWARDAVVRYGTPQQQDRFAGPTATGEITWCQLFSEPEAGSDLASLATRAVRAPGGWRLTGQKVWTSLAREADWGICLARTDPDPGVPKHRGLTFFLVDMRSGGIDIRPLREITGRAMFNEVFLDDVFVPDDCVLGEPGEGWRIARSTLAAERVAMARGSSFGAEAENLLALAGAAGAIGAAGAPGAVGAAGARTLERVGGLVADGLAGSLLDLRSALAQSRGTDAGHLAAVRKLLGVAHRQSVAETALELSGPEGAAADGAAAGAVHEFLLSRCLSIAGGTTQILLSVVAERVLGLPRQDLPRQDLPREDAR
jgi:alkylation response protein AidB-like acyl-CoA dehydrogenase